MKYNKTINKKKKKGEIIIQKHDQPERIWICINSWQLKPVVQQKFVFKPLNRIHYELNKEKTQQS